MYTFFSYAIFILNITDQEWELYIRFDKICNFNFEDQTDFIEIIC